MSYDEAIFQMYLGEVPMFRACSEEELSAIAYLASPRALEAGSEVGHQEDQGMAGEARVFELLGVRAAGGDLGLNAGVESVYPAHERTP